MSTLQTSPATWRAALRSIASEPHRIFFAAGGVAIVSLVLWWSLAMAQFASNGNTPPPVLAQRTAAARPWRVAQLLDTSPEQQELSRDYSTGIRLAFAEQVVQSRAAQIAQLESLR